MGSGSGKPGTLIPLVVPDTPLPSVHSWCVPASGTAGPGTPAVRGRAPNASCRPASGLGGRTRLFPKAEVRTIHACGALGVSVPSGCRYPGSIDVGIGSGSVNGLRINGLVGKTSIGVRPVTISMSCGVWSRKPEQLWPHANLGTETAAPHIRLSLMSSRRLNLVISGLFISPPTTSPVKNLNLTASYSRRLLSLLQCKWVQAQETLKGR